ncbi:hypothetical protein FOZ60_007865 [Perkinsus olseni]|uniref:Uncharacterized protein n=2 Tax=Perkinsus olseni TaxID=32597 RepID=A0A7J6NLZ9_PEROL|nr:hypothetical protein FOZ60_007865 [Perkinsus olseni]
MVHTSLLFLIAFGAGGIKSCVNVMGAQQYHPKYHQTQINKFFNFFFACISIGALIGGVTTPLLLQAYGFTASFSFPLILFAIGTAVFICGGVTDRFVKREPQGSAVLQVVMVLLCSVRHCSVNANKESKGGNFKDNFIEDAKAMFRLLPLFSLIIPFAMATNCYTTTFITQAYKMDRDVFGWEVPAAMMPNVDPIGVFTTSILSDKIIFPMLRRRGLMPSVLGRFCIGTCFGIISLVIALILEYIIKSNPLFTVSVLWQVPMVWFMAMGGFYVISTSYEAAFIYSPESLKAVASACNLCYFAIASVLSAVLFSILSPLLPNFEYSHPTKSSHEDSHYEFFYMVLIGLCVVAAIGSLCLAPYFKRVTARNEALLSANEEMDEEGREHPKVSFTVEDELTPSSSNPSLTHIGKKVAV